MLSHTDMQERARETLAAATDALWSFGLVLAASLAVFFLLYWLYHRD